MFNSPKATNFCIPKKLFQNQKINTELKSPPRPENALIQMNEVLIILLIHNYRLLEIVSPL